jgi:hypothetical protein
MFLPFPRKNLFLFFLPNGFMFISVFTLVEFLSNQGWESVNPAESKTTVENHFFFLLFTLESRDDIGY